MSTRRTFLKTVALGAGLTPVASARSHRRIIGANERIRVAVIGTGRRSRSLINAVKGQDDVQIVGLSDVYQPNLDYVARNVPEAETAKDYRTFLDRDDIDAVIIGSPDHWHALQTIHACQAGKDVYVEKPVSTFIGEGRDMVNAAREHDRIVQVGTQQRSGTHFQKAAELIQSGKLGIVHHVRTWNFGNTDPEGIGNPPDAEPPEGLDWDMWLGPAPERAYNVNRFGVILDEDGDYQRWASFRWFWDYAGGMMTDWGVHHLDIVHLVMQVEAPTFVSAVGGKFVLQDNRDTPDTITATYQFPGFTCIYENRVANGYTGERPGYGMEFYGSNGTLFLNRGGFEVYAEEGRDATELKEERSNDTTGDHLRNFFDSVKSREQPLNDIEIGHRSTTTAILGNIAYRVGRGLRWDAEAEQILDDPDANALLMRAYREPYTL